ncbi:MAG: hypothetical protein A2912_03985 [Candidatus Buchananbacteria bacterium RIFCSPLOWO2_01_FULL_40_23b]|uniref:STAS/SEC14 domain-containing protein n=1 Tax=Candidatus Buchananbacteria bacterium RIFCSPLOWO2_01_FULL_40_23b TaxID=1797544 RepID=A0A1G1YSA6_9BACT|nr:MAG: hypothetical protein A2912_03985 [Candidatus Buchananbacteria bacterium RIFCSPLOWO2_01_FULL_40_23b]
MLTDFELLKTFSVSKQGEKIIKLVMFQGVTDVATNIRQAELIDQAINNVLINDNKFNGLVDLSALGPAAHYPSPKARQIYSDLVNQERLEKIAVIAPQLILRSIMRFIATKTMTNKPIKFFKDYNTALNWLMDKNETFLQIG